MTSFGENKHPGKRKISHLQQNYDEKTILNKAINLHYSGNILKANKLYKFLIEQGSNNSTISQTMD